MVLGVWLAGVRPVEAGDTALEALLDILRARGSINEEEYQAIRKLADADAARTASAIPATGGTPSVEPAAVVGVPAAPVAAIVSDVAPALAVAPAPQAASLAAAPAPGLSQADIEREVPTLIGRALSGKWYERLSLRGYTQFRMTEVLNSQGAAVEVPADRSVNANESFLIRRGRFIFSGDPSEHLYLYAQMDFNASTGAADYSLQMRDLYADVAFDKAKAWRLRLGQSKVPYGFVNLQSSQNRAPIERPDILNSAVEGERDLGAYLMWASPEARRRFRDLVSLGLKGSGDYGVVAVGGYSGQGLNRSDQDGGLHYIGRVSYPFKTAGGQYWELGAQAYTGRFVTPLQAITTGGATFTPTQAAGGVRDARVAATFVLYPQPFGIESEWTFGQGPSLTADGRRVEADSVKGGYIQMSHRSRNAIGTFFPFVRWQYFDGARKFARNAPRTKVNEIDFGLEFARWAELEITAMYTRTFDRTRTSAFPYDRTLRANRFGLQFQWNY
jgi:hypothetical protein